ncbi:fimbrial biogenesis chaperone [Deinococcus sedimenti]|uniref:Pili assembly chaperone N-terminal domain-containing protein n=1 Tax=Deinococcus sedimenti TaxID=1867090 RepID=A0ABQ2SAA8_9DEIO|nr:fimbria/pilus periplasmic chaperone [Deinococcus sedimenti]GGS07376.1 hypothetical protein GCM10008960_37220 [Deinococcus sedimenti]
MRRAAGLLLLLGAAAAQGFSVSPTAFNLNPERTNTAQVRFENPSGGRMSFQVEVRRWSTRNGEHVYEPTRDVIVNPASFTLARGEAQVIRLGLLKKAGADELTYRVFVQQVSGDDVPTQTTGSEDAQMNVRQLVQLSLPVYVTPPASAARVAFQARVADQEVTLDLVNSGNAHQTYRVLNVQVGDRSVVLGSAAVLGRSTLSLPLGALGGARTVTVQFTDAAGKAGRETISIP